jgi:hypothetical protein
VNANRELWEKGDAGSGRATFLMVNVTRTYP